MQSVKKCKAGWYEAVLLFSWITNPFPQDNHDKISNWFRLQIIISVILLLDADAAQWEFQAALPKFRIILNYLSDVEGFISNNVYSLRSA